MALINAGAGVASILSLILKPSLPSLQCYAYATPCCLDLDHSKHCQEFVHACILRDDVVPRMKPANATRLVKEILAHKSDWSKFAREDMSAVVERAKSIWAPKRRVGPDEIPPIGELKKDENSQEEKSKSKSSRSLNSTDGQTEVVDTNIEIAVEIAEKSKGPELFIPGNIVHLYFVEGVYKAALVPQNFASLERIELYQNMLEDHRGINYMSAIRITQDALRAQQQPPAWMPYGSSDVCRRCDARFTWAAVSDSSAQTFLEQKNCRKCGELVCSKCSESRAAIPEYGINVPVRICDRCQLVHTGLAS